MALRCFDGCAFYSCGLRLLLPARNCSTTLCFDRLFVARWLYEPIPLEVVVVAAEAETSIPCRVVAMVEVDIDLVVGNWMTVIENIDPEAETLILTDIVLDEAEAELPRGGNKQYYDKICMLFLPHFCY